MKKPGKRLEPGYDEDWTLLYSYQNIAGVPEMIKQFEQQEGLVSYEDERRLVRQAVAVLCIQLYDLALREMEQSRACYLALPVAIRVIEREASYRSACAVGRLWYRLSQFEVNEETYEVERVPASYTRQELFEDMSEVIRLSDARLAAATPLAYRVGYCVGWLSGLAVSQPDEVGAVMVMLAALVAPLLLPADCVQQGKKKAPVKQLLKRVKRA